MEKEFKFIGINGNNELVFFNGFNNLFGGAGGVTMSAGVTQQDIDNGNDLKYVMKEYDYLWREAVNSGETNESLEEYCEGLIEQTKYSDSLFLGDDPSYRWETNEAISKLPEEVQKAIEGIVGVKDEDFVEYDCVSCGYLFACPNDLDTSDWKLVHDKELIAKIISVMKKK